MELEEWAQYLQGTVPFPLLRQAQERNGFQQLDAKNISTVSKECLCNYFTNFLLYLVRYELT